MELPCRTHGTLLKSGSCFAGVPKYLAHGPNFRVVQHALPRILDALATEIGPPKGWSPILPGATAVDTFLGYLLLDALIGNTDRHHENWAILVDADGKTLAPSFDHASCLGRELTDAKRQDKLRPLRRDQTVVGYLEGNHGRSRIYASEGDDKPLRPLEVFHLAASFYPKPAEAWLNRLRSTPLDQLCGPLDRVPEPTISTWARDFGRRVVELNFVALTMQSKGYG